VNVHDIRDMERITAMKPKKTKAKKALKAVLGDSYKKPTKADRERWAAQDAEEKRVAELVVKQDQKRAEMKKTGRGLEPQHAVISCPDCAAKLLIGVDFVEHRI